MASGNSAKRQAQYKTTAQTICCFLLFFSVVHVNFAHSTPSRPLARPPILSINVALVRISNTRHRRRIPVQLEQQKNILFFFFFVLFCFLLLLFFILSNLQSHLISNGDLLLAAVFALSLPTHIMCSPSCTTFIEKFSLCRYRFSFLFVFASVMHKYGYVSTSVSHNTVQISMQVLCASTTNTMAMARNGNPPRVTFA